MIVRVADLFEATEHDTSEADEDPGPPMGNKLITAITH